MIILACIDAAGGLGYRGRLPWHVSAELRYFKKRTMGHTLGVGSGTELPPLPGRTVVRLSRSSMPLASFEGIVIGGATIFEAALRLASSIELSVLPDTYTCDCFFNMVTLDRLFVLTDTRRMDGFSVLTFTRRDV